MANELTHSDLLNAANAYPAGMRYNVLAGAGADTNIAVTNIAMTDKIISCTRIVTLSGAVSDVTSEVVILSAGNVQLTDTVTTGDKLLLSWYDKN